MSLSRRVERLEASAPPTVSGPRSNWTPEQEASRARQFEDLFRELGMPQPPPVRDPAAAFEEIFELISRCREEIDREESDGTKAGLRSPTGS